MCVATNKHGHATIVINNCGVRNSGKIVDLAPDAIERRVSANQDNGREYPVSLLDYQGLLAYDA